MIKFIAWLSGLWQLTTMAYVGVSNTLPSWARWSLVAQVALVALWWSISAASNE